MAQGRLEQTLAKGGGPVDPNQVNTSPVVIQRGSGEDESDLVNQTGEDREFFEQLYPGGLSVGEKAVTFPNHNSEVLEQPAGTKTPEPVGIDDLAVSLWRGLGEMGAEDGNEDLNERFDTIGEAFRTGVEKAREQGMDAVDAISQGMPQTRKQYNEKNAQGEDPIMGQPDISGSQEIQGEENDGSSPLSENEKFTDDGTFIAEDEEDKIMAEGGGPVKPPSEKNENEEDFTYTIQQGDTLSKIAKKHGTSVQKLAQKNNIDDPDRIVEGRDLVIPGAQPSASEPDTDFSSSRAGTSGQGDSQIGKDILNNTNRILNGETDFTELPSVKQKAKQEASEAVNNSDVEIIPPDELESPQESSRDAQKNINQNNTQKEKEAQIGKHASNVFGFIASMAEPEIYQSFVRSAQNDRKLDLRETQQRFKERQAQIDRSMEVIENKKDFAETYQEQLEKTPASELNDQKRRKIFVNLARENRELVSQLRNTGQLETFRRGLTKRNVNDEINKFGVQLMEQQAKSVVNSVAQADSEEEVRQIKKRGANALSSMVGNLNVSDDYKKSLQSMFRSRVDFANREEDEDGDELSEQRSKKIKNLRSKISDLDTRDNAAVIKNIKGAVQSLNPEEKRELIETTGYTSISEVNNYLDTLRDESTFVSDDDIKQNVSSITSDLQNNAESFLRQDQGGLQSFLTELGFNDPSQAAENFTKRHISQRPVITSIEGFLQQNDDSRKEQDLAKRAVRSVEGKYLRESIEKARGQYDEVDDAVNQTILSPISDAMSGIPFAGEGAAWADSLLSNITGGGGDQRSTVAPQRSKDYSTAKEVIFQSDQASVSNSGPRNSVTNFIHNTLGKSDEIDINSDVRREIFKENLQDVIANSSARITDKELRDSSEAIINRINKSGNMSLNEINSVVNEVLVF